MTESVICPQGDGLHETDDPYGGPCSGCLAYVDAVREEFYADQMKAFPEWMQR